jgi:ElaB/YqjD/DUF883 family membrane-anchored ribosome-binding protein
MAVEHLTNSSDPKETDMNDSSPDGMLTAKAQKMAQHSRDLAAEVRERARQSLQRAAGVTGRYVADQPVRSILIAAGVGAGVALLLATARQRSRNRP